ncbi:hypothetical protein H0H93_006754 [Arthromyces matolae]|nr:hypothetical protein H0H93_006754 [Arthromyces matolae]
MLVQSTATYTHHSDIPPEKLLLALAEQRVSDVLALGTAASAAVPPIPTSLLNTSSFSASLLFQAYCLDPPIDSCDFGPCPNIDVTGIGQQISSEL